MGDCPSVISHFFERVLTVTQNRAMGVFMKLPIPLVSVFVVAGLVLTSSAFDYADIVAKGYRWSSVEGPYACPSKEDARKILARPSSSTDLDQSDRVRSYYLIPGMVVLVLETDAGGRGVPGEVIIGKGDMFGMKLDPDLKAGGRARVALLLRVVPLHHKIQGT